MAQALYRKYRSKSLDEIVGQSHITSMLRRAIASGNVAHAYLLTGPRGVGKTSIARILAHEINHLPYTDESTHLDIIEIDAASHTGVDDIRELRDKAQVAPAIAEKKIYIIDEVHMLSKSAFNALLKTLEEPPEHVIFILATTDVEKLPATIISRVQRFNFRTINPDDAVRHLRTIADAESINIDNDALELIAHHGKGSFRDSISLLDQLRNISDGTITAQLIQDVLGLADQDILMQILDSYRAHDVGAIVSLVNTIEARGTPAQVVTEQLIRLIRRRIADEPGLIPLIDRLLDVSRSAWPHIKLLTALTAEIAQDSAAMTPTNETRLRTKQPTTQTQSTQSKSVSNKNESLLHEKQSAARADSSAQSEAVSNERAASSTISSHSDSADAEARQDKKQVATSWSEREDGSATSNLTNSEATTNKSAQNDDTSPINDNETPASVEFPWNEFLQEVKKASAGAYTILTKCDYVFTGTILKIYAIRKFNKVKLDKNIAELAAAMQAVGVSDGTIEIVEQPAPPKDSQTAAILDIMGGGQEVSI